MADEKDDKSKDKKSDVTPPVFLKSTVQLSHDESGTTRITGGKATRAKGERKQ